MATSKGPDRSSYIAAIIVNAALIYLVSNLMEWDLLPFLTNGFIDVRGWIIISLIVAIAFNVLFLAFDPAWFRSIGRIAMSGFSLAVSIILYQKFPFDFTPYDFDWSLIVQVLIILAIGGTAVAILAELVKLARGERLVSR